MHIRCKYGTLSVIKYHIHKITSNSQTWMHMVNMFIFNCYIMAKITNDVIMLPLSGECHQCWKVHDCNSCPIVIIIYLNVSHNLFTRTCQHVSIKLVSIIHSTQLNIKAANAISKIKLQGNSYKYFIPIVLFN